MSVKGFITNNDGNSYRIHQKDFKIGIYDIILQFCRGKFTKWKTTSGIDDFTFFEKSSKLHGIWNRKTFEIGPLSLFIKTKN